MNRTHSVIGWRRTRAIIAAASMVLAAASVGRSAVPASKSNAPQKADRTARNGGGAPHTPEGVPVTTPQPPGSTQAPPALPGASETSRGSLGAGFTRGVNLFSGEAGESVVDLRIRGRGLDFVWSRSYGSRREVSTPMGFNWDHGYNIRLEQSGVNRILHDGNGRSDTYLLQGNGCWVAPEFARELCQNPDGSYTLTFADLGAWILHSIDGSPVSGRVLTIRDRNLNALQFQYDPSGRLILVMDTLGRPIQINYNPDGFISSVVDFAGRAVIYQYYTTGGTGGDFGDLRSMTTPPVLGTPNGNDFPTGKTVTYTYSTGAIDPRLNHNMLTITDAKGQTFLSNTYAPTTNPADIDFDHVSRQLWGGGNHIDIVYVAQTPAPTNNFAVIKAIVNDRVGNVKEVLFDAQNLGVIEREYTGRAPNPDAPTTDTINRPTGQLRPSDPVLFETRYTYNSAGRVLTITDPNQNQERFTYDSASTAPRSRGNILQHSWIAGPLGGDQPTIAESFTYAGGPSGFNMPLTHVDGRGSITMNAYDARGNRLHTTHRDGAPEDFEYNAFGQLTATILPPNGSGHRRRDQSLYYVGGPQNGYLQQTTVDAGGLNITTQYEYDSLGRLVRTIDPLGRDSLTTYNALDQVVRELSREAAPGIRYERLTWYDANNNVVRTDAENRDETGAIQPNHHFSVLYEYNVLNNRTRQCEERGGQNVPNNVVTCSGVDPTQFVTTDTAYDNAQNIALTRSGVAVNGSQPANTVTTLYDERGLVFRVRSAAGDPGQSTTQFDYDGNRNIARVSVGIEATPRVTTNVIDGHDRITRTTDPMGNVTIFHYDPNHNVVSVRHEGELVDIPGSAGNVRLGETLTQYDPMDRAIASDQHHFDLVSQLPIGDGESHTETAYDSTGAVIRVTDDGGNATLTTYDTANRVSAVTDPRGNVVAYVYDPSGNVIQTSEMDISDLGSPPETYVTNNVYDSLGRLVQSTDAVGNITQHAYDSRGNRVLTIDALGNQTRTTYDGLGRTVQTLAPGGISLGNAYDDNGRQTSAVDNNGNVTQYQYDALNRKVATLQADGTTNTVQYDIHGNSVQSTDANGTVTTVQFDLLNRQTQRSIVPGPGVSPTTTLEQYQYDGLSRMVHAQDNNSTIDQRFDSLSRPISETRDGLTTTSVWDAMGNKTRVAYPGGRAIDYQYDALNRVVRVLDAGAPLAVYSYRGPKRVERLTLANNTTTDYEFDGLANPPGDFGVRQITRTRSRQTLGPGVLDDRTYQYDRTQNRTERRDNTPGGPQLRHSYAYDPASRLINTIVRNSASVIVRNTTYTLDGVGNRLSVGGLNTPDSGSYTLDPSPVPADRQVNQYTRTPFDKRHYDNNGNLINVGLGGCASGDVNNDGVINALDAAALAQVLVNQTSNVCADINQDGNNDGNDIQPLENILNGGPPPLGAIGILYDWRNRMVQYSNAITGETHRYVYDAFGRRIRKIVNAVGGTPQVTNYLHDGWQVVEERDGSSSTTATYVWGLFVDEPIQMRRCGTPNILEHEFFDTLPPDWNFLGAATYDAPAQAARLTTSGVQNSAGVTYFNHAPVASDNFEVSFKFRIANLVGGVSDADGFPGPDGLMFFVTNAAPVAPGGIGRDLGYGGGFPAQSFGVEFDAFRNLATSDPDSNHVGLNVGGSVTSIATAPVAPNFETPGTWNARVRFNAGTAQVYLTPPGGSESLVLTAAVPPANNPAAKVFGFSSGTGLNSCDTFVDDVQITLLSDCGSGSSADYYYHTDANYNVVALSDAAGNVVERYDYGDYGIPSFFDVFYTPRLASLFGNPYLFQGREYDPETGFYYYRLRYYDPRSGRFTTRSAIGLWGDAFGNGFTFCGNNPWTWLDPMGRGQWYMRWFWWSWYRYQWWGWWWPWGWCGYYCYYWWWWYPFRAWLWWWWPWRWCGFTFWWWSWYGWSYWYPYRWSWWPYRWWWWWYPYRWWGYWYGWYWWWWPWQQWVWYPYGCCWIRWWYPNWWGYYGWYWWWWCPYRCLTWWCWWYYPYYWWNYYYYWWWGWWYPYRFIACWWYPYGWYSWYYGWYWWWWYPYGWGYWWWWYPFGWWGYLGWGGGCWCGVWWWWWWWWPWGWFWWWWWPWGWWWGWGKWWYWWWWWWWF